jgi:hypothetical protein
MTPDLYVAHVESDGVFEAPWAGEGHVLLVVALADVPDEDRARLASAMVAQGCRFVVCTGAFGAPWSASIAAAAPEERGVVTTTHGDEPLPSVVDFFRRHTALPDFEPRHFAVAIVGGDARQAAAVTQVVVSRVLDRPRPILDR